jgi:hypothetical protein
MEDGRMKVLVSVVVLLGALTSFPWLASEDVFGAPATALTQTQAGGGVTVKATYLNPQRGSDSRFAVAFDTHSVNLDQYDLKTIVSLRDESGKTYQAKGVETKGGGHHRQATIIFPRPSGKKLELVVKDIAGVKERIFQWDSN